MTWDIDVMIGPGKLPPSTASNKSHTHAFEIGPRFIRLPDRLQNAL